MFASHGALLIANSEKGLEVHDVKNGWDWAKVPGATTIALGSTSINDLSLDSGRFYNPRPLAGGLTFQGTLPLKNGLFGMDFHQPEYDLETADWRHGMQFDFKKSFFFFENLLICLGSNITSSNTNEKVVQTTLFQDRFISASSSIKVNGVEYSSTTLSATTPSSEERTYTTLTDVNGNFYYIPDPSKSILNVHVQTQNSRTDGGAEASSGDYGTAWFEHGTSPSIANGHYEYAVLIPTDGHHPTLTDLSRVQETPGNELYKVLQKNSTAHVIQFLKSPKTWSALSHNITGYVMFTASTSFPAFSPIEAVNEGNCLVMVQITNEYIYLSISSPGLNLTTSSAPLHNSEEAGQKELYHSSSREREIEVKLRSRVQERIISVQAHDNPDCYKPNVWVLSDGKTVRFWNLKNGFSVEVKLKISLKP